MKKKESIWKDISELPKGLDGAAVLYKFDDQIFIGEAHSFGSTTIYPAPGCDFVNESNIEKICILKDFINEHEQLKKDVGTLRKRLLKLENK